MKNKHKCAFRNLISWKTISNGRDCNSFLLIVQTMHIPRIKLKRQRRNSISNRISVWHSRVIPEWYERERERERESIVYSPPFLFTFMSTGTCVYRHVFVMFSWIFYEKRHDNIYNTFEDILFKNTKFQNTKYKRLKVLRLKKCSVTLTAYTVLIPIDL